MAHVGTAPAGKTLIGTGTTSSPTFASIGTSSGLTTHGLIIGQGTGAFTAMAAGSAGQIVQSGGGSSDPVYSTATYPSTATGTGTILRANGTNWAATTATYPNTTTANQILYSSATNTISEITAANNGLLVTSSGGVPSILAGPGVTGKILQSNAAAAPSFSTATYPSTGGSVGTILRSDGTNWVATTATYPATTTINQILYSSANNTISEITAANNGVMVTSSGGVPSILAGPGVTGKVLQSNAAAAPSYSTATYPSTATSTGTILRADGTNWSATTATYPNTTTANQLLYSSSTNTVGGLTSANNGLLVTSSGGVPSILAGPGTTGNILQSNAAAAPSFSTATYPSTGGSAGTILRSDGTNWVASTPTYPNAASTAGKVVVSDGTNLIMSTPTFPNASATSGKIIISDGTNWIASTPTYPAAAGTSGNVLTSDGTNWTSAAAPGGGLSTATVTLTSAQIKALHATPIQIVAAPGSGKMINLVNAVAKYNYGGSNVFTAGASQVVDLQLGTNASFYGTGNGIVGNSLLTGTSTVLLFNRTFQQTTAGVSVANSENQPLNAYNPVATEITGNAANDNTIQINVLYSVVTI